MTQRWHAFLSLALLLAFPGCRPALGQSRTAELGQSSESSTTSLMLLPVVFYTPETRWAGGAAGLLSFWPAARRSEARPSTVTVYSVYTELKQFQLKVEPKLYFDDENWFLPGNLVIEDYPGKYWGIGNDSREAAETDFTPRRTSLEASFQKRVLAKQNLYLGLQVQVEHVAVAREEGDGGPLLSSAPGRTGGTVTGLGIILNWDTRNHIFVPTRGSYFQVSLTANSKLLGGDFDWTEVKADLRKFFPGLADSHVLGVQLLAQSAVGGSPPFYRYPGLGGDSIMRGTYVGRYRDRHLLAVQAEYRLPVWWKFGLVGFGGLGRVASSLSGLALGGLKYSAGIGLRFKIAPREGANLRVDWAFGRGTSGVYFTAGEAF